MDSDEWSHILFAAHGFRQQPSVGTDQSFAFNPETITQNPKLSATRGLVAVAHLIYKQNPDLSATRGSHRCCSSDLHTKPELSAARGLVAVAHLNYTQNRGYLPLRGSSLLLF
jgi:hypothetical protein